MTALTDRGPVIAGVGQVNQRLDDPREAREPLQLMIDALRGAAADAGQPRLLTELQHVVVVRGAWNYTDPGRLIAEAVGAHSSRTAITAEGGNSPQAALNHLFRLVSEGALDVAALVGGEGIYTRRRARRLGIEHESTSQRHAVPDERLGDDHSMSSLEEQQIGFDVPVAYYALFESALRAADGTGLEDHRTRVAEMLCAANSVAVRNPRAWATARYSVSQIRDVDADNRMIAYPYSKRMCSNWFTDQAAAVIVCSAAAVRRLGIDDRRLVHPVSGTDAHDTLLVGNRSSLHASPAIRVAGTRALELAGVAPADLQFVDLYSCFPSAVRVAADGLGIALTCDWTVTGAMAYFGGPLSNYVSHSVATTVDRLRDHGGVGLVTANGGYLTKHSFGVYSATAPDRPYAYEQPQPEVEATQSVEQVWGYSGAVKVEAVTNRYGFAEPMTLLAGRTPEGTRVFARSPDPDLAERVEVEELVGAIATVSSDGEVTRID